VSKAIPEKAAERVKTPNIRATPTAKNPQTLRASTTWRRVAFSGNHRNRSARGPVADFR
jgi:hypothetical protein